MKPIRVTIKPWAIYSVVASCILFSGIVGFLTGKIVEALAALLIVWLSGMFMLGTGLFITFIAGSVYKSVTNDAMRAQADLLTTKIRERQHNMLMKLPDEEFHRQTTALRARDSF